MSTGEQVTEPTEMLVTVDPEKCAATGMCLFLAGSIFKKNEQDESNVSVVHLDGAVKPEGRVVRGDDLALAVEAAAECHPEAITLTPVPKTPAT